MVGAIQYLTYRDLALEDETSVDCSHFDIWRPLHDTVEGRITGKPIRGIMRNIQMLHDLAKDEGYVVLKRAAEDRMETERKDVINLLYNRRLLNLTVT